MPSYRAFRYGAMGSLLFYTFAGARADGGVTNGDDLFGHVFLCLGVGGGRVTFRGS